MRISQIRYNIKLFYSLYIKPPKKWQYPKKSEILIFDAMGAEALMPYLAKYFVTTMTVRGESINIPCLFRGMLKPSFWTGKPGKAYTEAYIQVVLPKVVITFIDNNSGFYEISKSFPDIKTIFIQNGLRTISAFYGIVKSYNYHVDYMLVHGSAIGKYYQNYLSGQSISIGSLKNNAISNLSSVVNNDVLFISQWRCEPTKGTAFSIPADDTLVYWDEFFQSEIITLKFLDRWCVENNKHLKICGCTKNEDGLEIDFYSNCLQDSEWVYIPRKSNYSIYKLIDASEIVVSIDSTSGYEAISRSKRTAIFSCRDRGKSKFRFPFGWPKDLPNNGPFWTNDQDETQFQQIMDYLNTVSDNDWEKTRKYYLTDIMEFDPGNIHFISLLDNLITN